MTENELDLILQEGEGYQIEFKENVNSDLSKEIVAFSNSSGGRIFIGINDKNQICGISSNNYTISNIQNMASACDPHVNIEIEIFKNIINVKEGTNKPYRANKGFFIRD